LDHEAALAEMGLIFGIRPGGGLAHPLFPFHPVFRVYISKAELQSEV
jgi:hypothetical protein